LGGDRSARPGELAGGAARHAGPRGADATAGRTAGASAGGASLLQRSPGAAHRKSAAAFRRASDNSIAERHAADVAHSARAAATACADHATYLTVQWQASAGHCKGAPPCRRKREEGVIAPWLGVIPSAREVGQF